MSQRSGPKKPIIRHRDAVRELSCPYGEVRRIVTGGEGGVANVHVVTVTQGSVHYHEAYDEVYYVLGGRGEVTIDSTQHELRPGSVVVIPAGHPHSLLARGDDPLEFIIFGTPAMSIDDERAAPKKPMA